MFPEEDQRDSEGRSQIELDERFRYQRQFQAVTVSVSSFSKGKSDMMAFFLDDNVRVIVGR
jgi:hypothetical protein